MKVRLYKKHLKSASYHSNEDCPIARALKDKGYTQVMVGGYYANVNKDGKSFSFIIDQPYDTAHRIADAILNLKPITVILNAN